ncbi:MAG: alanine racemase [Thermoanaerobaculia bacterium]|nr:alanine racemase [Thermoanaerobaculia bacterium]
MTRPRRPSEAGAAAGVEPAAWATVDLDALRANLAELRRRVGPAAVLAVVKADAYGHGAVTVGRTLEEAGVEWLGVSQPAEAIELRRAGVELPLLVLGGADAPTVELCRRWRLTPAISSLEQLAAWSEAAAGAGCEVHLKVDTGMSRLGLSPGELPRALEVVRRGPLRLAGLFSHFAEADEPASPRNAAQAERFDGLLSLLTPGERESVLIHMANSAAALHHPASRHRLVRLGLALYGLDPARRFDGLTPVLSVAARIALLRDVERGARAGYGGTWVAEGPRRLAVVPVGYGDGYSWRLSAGGEALLHGRRVPIAGRVSMDMITLDVTGADARLGDEVVLLGRQGGDEITAFELADRAGTIAWEVLCGFRLRLARRVVDAGAPPAQAGADAAPVTRR